MTGHSLPGVATRRQVIAAIDRRRMGTGTAVALLAGLLALSGQAFRAPTTYAQAPAGTASSTTTAADIGALFLHSKGSRDSLDAIAPTGSKPQYKDSPALDQRSGGNEFKEFGSWSTVAATGNQSLASLTAFFGFFALKASTDTGATFDVRVELLKNEVVIGTGSAVDIAQLPPFQTGTSQVAVPLSALSATSITQGDVLKLRVLTRIGGNSGLTQAAGVRMFYDSADRPSRVGPAPKANTTTSIVSNTNPSTFGQSATFAATVAGGPSTPTGTVAFFDGTNSLGTGTLNGSGQATLATAALGVGTHSITAQYQGDSSHNGSISAALAQTVNKANTVTAVVSSANPSTVGQGVTFTATVTGVSATPTGTVAFFDGQAPLATVALNAGGQAAITTLTLTAGAHSITTQYSGNASYNGSTSSAITQTVNTSATTTAIVSSGNPSAFGQSVTFTSTVTGGTITPTGLARFLDGASLLGTGMLNGSGQATLTTTALAVGPHQVTAQYQGDSAHDGSTSGALAQIVNQADTTTTILSSANPSTPGQSVTFTAQVAVVQPGSGTPTGDVTFTDGATALGTGALNNLGRATLTTATLSAGAHQISARYQGDSSFNTSTSAALTQTVNKTNTTTTVVTSITPSTFGQGVTFTATVAGGSTTPTGTITFFDGANSIGTNSLDGAGQAALTTTTLAVGSHSITFRYPGDNTHDPSTSGPVVQSVNKANTATVVSSSKPSSSVGDNVTFTSRVTVTPPGSGTPTGTVTFSDGATTLGTAAPDGSGQATLSTSSLLAGTHSITAAYNGDPSFNGSTSAPVTQNVAKQSTTTTIVSNNNPSTFGQAVLITATVAGGSALPTGQVQFLDGQSSLGTGSLNQAGQAAISTTALSVGGHSITAQYQGDGSHEVSTSAVLTQTVKTAAPTNQPPVVDAGPDQTITLPASASLNGSVGDDGLPQGGTLSLAWSKFSGPGGVTFASGNTATTTATFSVDGTYVLRLTASDSELTAFDDVTVNVSTASIVLTSIDVTPELLRFSALAVDRALTVTGAQSNGSSIDLTQSPDTTYESSNPFVATVDASGNVHSVANGSATITVHHTLFTDTAALVVELGVDLESLALAPSTITLRTLGATAALTLQGHFSDGETRDLTTSDGTVFKSSNPGVASVDGTGHVTAIGNGDATITARQDTLTASATVHVIVSAGVGFVRGQVFDDSKGLPLGGAAIELLADGSGALPTPSTTIADDGGRFALEGRAGDAVLRISTPGFTRVERRATIPALGAVTVLNPRLTPIDRRANAIASVFGGEARDSGGGVKLTLPPGVLPADTDVRLTPVSGQGPQGRFPLGWSPVAGVDISPSGVVFPQPAALTLPNVAGLPAGAPVVAVTFDAARHDWVSIGSTQVGTDGRVIGLNVGTSGQIFILARDEAPFTPTMPGVGDVLAGSPGVALPPDVTATGVVVPRSAPPGNDTRAVGRVLFQSSTALPSGTVLQVNVSERFDLTDQSQVVPQPFVEDLVLYARGRPAGDGILGASVPITPSKHFTIQELFAGVVSLDVAAPPAAATVTIVGAAGGSVINGNGDALDIPAASLTADAVLQLRRAEAGHTLLPVPAGFDLIAALDVDLVGVTLAQPARLSIPASSLSPADQFLLAGVFSDPLGTLRLRLVGIATIGSGRLASQSVIAGLTLPGVVAGGEYMFLRAQLPVGFLTGQLLGPDGVTPRSRALITSDTAPFVDVTSAIGRFIVAGRATADSSVRALDVVTHDTASRTVHLDLKNEVALADLTLAVVAPTVVSTNPSSNASHVPLDASVSIDFSDAIDPATITDTGVALQVGGSPVAGQRTLSSDRRHLVFRPASPLPGKSTFTLTLTGLQSVTGRALTGFTSLIFVTLDPSKATLATSGLIVGDLPDEDGFVLVTGNPGAADASSPVTATNLRTQETTTALANQDGSFRLRIAAVIGDEIAVTLRDSSRRDTTISLTQLHGADGTTTVSERGGTISGSGGRVGIVLPRALTQPGLFRIEGPGASATLPTLPAGFTAADQFHFSSQAAQLNRLATFTLTESQNRFAPATATIAPFASPGDLTVPGDFLVNASLRFTATAVDTAGVRRTASAATLVVPSNADGSAAEGSQTTDFPTVFVTAPRQALQNQLVHVDAIAPTARVDLEAPAPSGIGTAQAVLLVRRTTVNSEIKLSVIDAFTRIDRDGATLLKTSGRDLPGMSSTGDYAAIASANPLVFVTGRLTGSATIATLDGSPFIFETDGPNGTFALPVVGGQPFSIRYLDRATGLVVGTSSGQAPPTGRVDLGSPLAPPTSKLSVRVDPDPQAIVDINQVLTFHFSEPVDGRTLSGGIIVSDSAGARVFGTLALAADNVTATFKPVRRWRFGITYRWGVATSVLAISGARLQQQASGDFTIFAPRLVSTIPLGAAAHDVATAGTTAVVATDSGLATVDASNAVTPAVRGQLLLTGGAHGAALLPDASIIDRLGESHSGNFAIVAAGDATGIGQVSVVDVSALATPAQIGSAQLTTGGGTPNAVAVTADQRAIVAVQSVGVDSVRVADAVPANPTNPGGAVNARYPSSSAESINHAAVLGDRIVTVGAAGLTVLDATALERRGGVSTTGNARGVAVLPGFSMDPGGDGTIAVSEKLDLAAVANGSDGTLQFYRVPSTGDPVLLSVVHFTGETTSVALDVNERLAYVGLGPRGVALVDLDGPMSVQPIDVDHDGSDDRILGIVDTPGDVHRTALALDRALAFVADGSSGLAVLQVLPPRAKFLDLARDPILAAIGDEESILSSRRAFTTDDAIQVSLSAVVPPVGDIRLVLDERTAGARSLSFMDGSTVASLTSGVNNVIIRIARGASPSSGSLTVQDESARPLARLDVKLETPDTTGLTLGQIFVAPMTAVLPPNVDVVRVSVGGRFSDGLVRNLTLGASDTQYVMTDERIATVDQDGAVTAIAGGSTDLTVQNNSVMGFGAVQVQHQAELVKLEPSTPFLTLRSTEAPVTLDVIARFSDRTTRQARDIPGTTFSSSNPAVAAINGAGVVTAVADGLATIDVINGAHQASIQVMTDLRTTPSVTGITLAPLATGLTTDDSIAVEASIQGTGALEGLVVSFSMTGAGAATRDGETDFEGFSGAQLPAPATPGTVTITASVVDPTSGTTRADSRTVTIGAGAGDTEPNNTDASASHLPPGTTTPGLLNVSTDPRDVYRVDAPADGTATFKISVPDGTTPQNLTVIVRDVNGNEIARQTLTQAQTEITVPVAAGGSFLTVEATSGAASYTISFGYQQGPLTISSVTPTAGGRGTLVTITGTGMSRVGEETAVFFGGIAGKTILQTPTLVQVQVPADGVNGPIQVTAGTEAATGPTFITGNAVFPQTYVLPENSAMLRQDPVDASVVDISRLTVDVDPLATQAEIQQLATSLGATIAGVLPLTHTYILSFPGVLTFTDLEARRKQLAGNSQVVGVELVRQFSYDSTRIDARDLAGVWTGFPPPVLRRSQAYEQIRLFDAIDAVRRSPSFQRASSFQPVRVAIIDSGFDPLLASEFQAGGSSYVTRLERDASGVFRNVGPRDTHDHGTGVAGVIAANNNGSVFNGVLGGLVREDELTTVFGGASPKFQVLVYSCPLDAPHMLACAEVAINDLAGRMSADPTRATVVNMSFGLSLADMPRVFKFFRLRWQKLITSATTRGALFVASAGNDGVYADKRIPGTPVSAAPNGLTVGASNTYTDERADYSIFGGAFHVVRHDVLCQPMKTSSSNCGHNVDLAAPGAPVFTTSAHAGGFIPIQDAVGTSFAAPLVAGVAAMVQAIRPTPTPIAAATLKDLLLDTADHLPLWDPPTDSKSRVNAMAAVRRLLPPQTASEIYISDSGVIDPAGVVNGGVVRLPVPPKFIEPPSGGVPLEPLTRSPFRLDATVGSSSFPVGAPGRSVITTSTNRLFAFARSSFLGDGIAVVNAETDGVEDFIPLSGADLVNFPSSPPANVVLPTFLRPQPVLSKDERLLYVNTGAGLAIINTVSRTLVRSYADLPDPFRPVDPSRVPSESLQSRLDGIHQRVDSGTLTDLTISPDGRTLYAALRTFPVAGISSGAVLSINIDLFRDVEPKTPFLESDLNRYLTVESQVEMEFQGAHDEPGAIAAAPDGNTVYFANGGFADFLGAPLFFKNTAINYDLLYSPNLVGAASGASPDVLIQGAVEMLETNPDARQSGTVLMIAPGFIEGFSTVPGVTTGLTDRSTRIPSEVVFGWQPPTLTGFSESRPVHNGRIVNQFHFKDVYGKRPFGMTIRPDSRRALVSLGQTGNFGLLDLTYQQLFTDTSLRVPDRFTGLVAVTKPIEFYPDLVPRRGAVREGASETIKAIDRALWYPRAVEYAQNGRFAVAVHNGGKEHPGNNQRTILQDFSKDETVRLELLRNGFAIEQGHTKGKDPDGVEIHANDFYQPQRGGGAVTIIDDEEITTDLNSHAGTLASDAIDASGIPRPYYSSHPLSTASAVTSRTYSIVSSGGTTEVQYDNPQGVAIQPFVVFETPRFGDYVSPSTPISFRWFDSTPTKLSIKVTDLDSSTATFTRDVLFSSASEDKNHQSVKLTFAQLFTTSSPLNTHRYRIQVDLVDEPAGGSLFVVSSTTIEVKFLNF